MKKTLLVTAALAVSASMALAASDSVIRLGTEGAYPPYNFINDSGEVDGFERELGDELCSRAELTCEWVTNEWDSIIPNLVSGNYDAIIAGMSITDQREEVIDFTSNYTQPDPSAYLALDGSELDLEGGVFAAQSGTIQASHIAESGATLLEFATPEESVAAVRNGEADAVLADKAYLLPIAEESSDLALVGDDVLIGGGLGMGIRESDTELNETFSRGDRRDEGGRIAQCADREMASRLGRLLNTARREARAPLPDRPNHARKHAPEAPPYSISAQIRVSCPMPRGSPATSRPASTWRFTGRSERCSFCSRSPHRWRWPSVSAARPRRGPASCRCAGSVRPTSRSCGAFPTSPSSCSS